MSKVPDNVYEQLKQYTLAAIDAAGVGDVTPSGIANAVLKRITVERPLTALVAYASLQFLKDLARRCARAKYEVGGELNESYQGDMFTGLLQKRYPVHKDERIEGEARYVPLNDLTFKSWSYNKEQLLRHADALVQPADALDAWGKDRFKDEG